MVRDAVLKGVGAPCLPISLVNHDLAAGRLAQWGEADGPEIAVWALYPSRHLLSARDSAFLDPLKGAFPNGTPDELAGCIVRVERHAGRPRCVTVDAIDERLQRRWPPPPSWIVEKRAREAGPPRFDHRFEQAAVDLQTQPVLKQVNVSCAGYGNVHR